MGLGASSGVCSIYLSILEVPFLSPDFVSSKILTVTIFEARRKIFISYFFQQTDLSVAEDIQSFCCSIGTSGLSAETRSYSPRFSWLSPYATDNLS